MGPISRRRAAGALGAGTPAAAGVPPLKSAAERGTRQRVPKPAKRIDPDGAILTAPRLLPVPARPPPPPADLRGSIRENRKGPRAEFFGAPAVAAR